MIDWKKLKESVNNQDSEYYVLISGDKNFQASNFYTSAFGECVETALSADILNAYVMKMLSKVLTKYKKVTVITGDNRGCDSMVAEWSLSHDIDVRKYDADWDNKGKQAGFVRNELMMSYTGLHKHKGAILFWDGIDNMTRNLIWLSGEYSVPLRVYNYKTCKSLTSEQIEQVRYEEREKQLFYGRY